MRCASGIVAGLLIVAALAQPGSAATFGLVVGINEYNAEIDLHGAVNDAEDVASALETYGARDVRLLLNWAADRAAIEANLKELIAGAAAGDTVVFTYSGHGSYAPAWDDSEADGRDEFFVLSGFDRNDVEATGAERIIDHELRQWLEEGDKRGVRTVLVADSCYSGGMARGFELNTRSAPPMQVPLPPPPGAAPPADASDVSEMRFSTFISGALESQLVYEITVDGKPRGALSYAFARAIEGDADVNADGEVSRREMQDYVAAMVKSRAASLQAPEFLPRSSGAESPPLFEGVSLKAASDRAPEVPNIPFRIVGDTLELAGIIEGEAGFVWNAGSGELITPFGDIAASGVAPEGLQAVVDKFRLVEMFNAALERASMTIAITPFRQVHDAGRRVSLDISAPEGLDVVVFDLVNDGSVQYLDLFPGEGDTETLTQFEVVPPFGADHLIAIALPPTDAARVATVLTGAGVTASSLVTSLPPLLAGARVGVQPFYTRSGDNG